MNELLKYFAVILKQKTGTLKKKGILIEKPWALIDDDGSIQKLIFKQDGGLILSKNGQVTEGSWQYFAEAHALLIDRGVDKLLLKEQYIDENILILKKDGTDNEFFAFANENTLPDYDVSRYLNHLKRREFNIIERKLLYGKVAQIYNGRNLEYIGDFVGLKIDLLKTENGTSENSSGDFMTDDKSCTFSVIDGIITSIHLNVVKTLDNENSFEISGGNSQFNFRNINKKVTINGEPIPNSRLKDSDNYIYEIRESKILKILVINTYFLRDGSKIKVEQNSLTRISKGDRIVEAKVFPLPDGSYKIQGRLFKVSVENNVVV